MRPSFDSLMKKVASERIGWTGISCILLLCGLSIGILVGDAETSQVPPRDFNPPAPPVSRPEKGAGKVYESLTDRAFWGAPPPMPHRFTKEWDAENCLQCHANKNDIVKRQQAISPVPHAQLSQCQQCHVRAVDPDAPLFTLSNFVGLGYPGKGSRATPGAPPTIPHQTFMREHCLSCHGSSGEQRIETPHPYRSQCRQCHVSQIDREYSRFGLR